MKFFKTHISLSSVFEFFLCLFVFLLPWSTIWIIHESFFNGSKLDYETIGIYVVEIILWCTVGTALLAWKLKNKEENNIFRVIQPHEKKILFCIGIFLLYIFSSVLWSWNKAIGLMHWLRIFEAIGILFFVFFSTVDAKKLLQWFVAGAVAQSVLGIYQFMTQSTFSFKWLGLVSHPLLETGTSVIQSPEVGRWLRAYGAFPHPNIFGGYLIVGLICTALIFLFFEKKKHTLIVTACWILQLMALFFTFSRSAWLSAIILLFLLFVFVVCVQKKYGLLNFKKKSFLLIIISLIFIPGMIYVYFPLIQTRAQVQSFHEVRSVEERKSALEQGLGIFFQHPFFGVGSGNYTVALKEGNPQAPGHAIQPVHNVFLLFLCELGIVGLLIFFSHIPFYLHKIKGKRLFVLGMVCVFAPILLLDHYIYSLPIGMFFFAFLLGIGKKVFSTVYPQNIH